MVIKSTCEKLLKRVSCVTITTSHDPNDDSLDKFTLQLKLGRLCKYTRNYEVKITCHESKIGLCVSLSPITTQNM